MVVGASAVEDEAGGPAAPVLRNSNRFTRLGSRIQLQLRFCAKQAIDGVPVSVCELLRTLKPAMSQSTTTSLGSHNGEEIPKRRASAK